MDAPRTIVITGASDGIGAAAARRLHREGHRVVVIGRSAERTAQVAEELEAPSYLVDFSRLDSVRELADRLLADLPHIDVLANNAGGIRGREREVTGDGHELTFQLNYLAPYLLTRLLLDRLLESRATVVNTSSVANTMFGHLDIEDLEATKSYRPRRAYGNAKLAQILFTRELDRRYGEQGLASAAFHPGVIASSFAGGKGSALGLLYQNPLTSRFMGTTETGADTLVQLAEHCPSPAYPSGGYFASRQLARANRQADDPRLAAELWSRSAALVGLDEG